MGGKGTQRRNDGLIISDIGIHGIKIRNDSAVAGNRNAAVAHQRKQTDDLHRYRLSAGIGTCDQQHVPRFFEVIVIGYNLLGINQRVPRLFEGKSALLSQCGNACIMRRAPLCPGKYCIKDPGRFQVSDLFIGNFSNFFCAFDKDAVDFPCLLFLQLGLAVVGGDDFRRLDIGSLSAGGIAIDKAMKAVLVRSFYKDDGTVIAVGNDRIHDAVGMRMHEAGHGRLHVGVRMAKIGPYISKIGRCRIPDLAIGIDAGFQLRCRIFMNRDRGSQIL